MKTPTMTGLLLMTVLVAGGCVDREAEARRVREEAEAKARAEAARKEMETLPKVFKNRDYLKKVDDTAPPSAAEAPKK
jgi:hypothetical protein